MSEIQRYRLNVEGRPKAKNQWVAEQRHKKGGWCKWSSVQRLERQLEAYKYDLETLVAIVSDCVSKLDTKEAFEVLREVNDHYEQLKEKGENE